VSSFQFSIKGQEEHEEGDEDKEVDRQENDHVLRGEGG
jgi:hypothetical protein